MTDDQPAEARQLLKTGGHKYDHGHLAVIAGAQAGAARLAARAAMRIGAGLVTLLPPSDALARFHGGPDALMLHPLNEPGGLEAWCKARKVSALLIGPGCGIDRAHALLPAVLASGLPAIVDADAITALAAHPGQKLRPDIVLTPHEGEFKRLCPDLTPTDDPDQRDTVARTAAQRWNATILLKGPVSVIAHPDGTNWRHDASDAPQLATAGSGDVLAGLIGGLLARSFDAALACRLAAWVHAQCARRFGPGLIADDLPEQIPALLRELA